MNANENVPKANLRINRIKIVSRFVRYAILALLVFVIGSWLFCCLRNLPSSPSYTLDAWGHALLGLLLMAVLGLWYWNLAKLFRFYERGLIFAAETIRCMRTLGALCVVSWMLFTLQEFVFHPVAFQKFAILPRETQIAIPEGTHTNTIYALYLPPKAGPAPTQIVLPEITPTNTINLLYLRQAMVPAPTQLLKAGFFNFSIGRINFGLLLSGIIIFIVAWIMEEGRKIQEEQELTV